MLLYFAMKCEELTIYQYLSILFLFAECSHFVHFRRNASVGYAIIPLTMSEESSLSSHHPSFFHNISSALSPPNTRYSLCSFPEIIFKGTPMVWPPTLRAFLYIFFLAQLMRCHSLFEILISNLKLISKLNAFICRLIICQLCCLMTAVPSSLL